MGCSSSNSFQDSKNEQDNPSAAGEQPLSSGPVSVGQPVSAIQPNEQNLERDNPFKMPSQSTKNNIDTDTADIIGNSSFKEVKINNVNCGVPVKIGNQIWLTGNIPAYPSVYGPQASCPKNFRIATKDDFSGLVDFVGLSSLYSTMQDKLKMLEGYSYATATKTFPESVFNDDDSYTFEGLFLDGKKVNFAKLNTFFAKASLHVKLIEKGTLDCDIKMPATLQRLKEGLFEFEEIPNIKKAKWSFGDGSYSNKLVVSKSYAETGIFTVTFELSMLGDREFKIEKTINVYGEFLKGNEELIKGTSYGFPLVMGDQVWLDRDLDFYVKGTELVNMADSKGPGTNGENSLIYSIESAPVGWRVPTLEDIKQLLDYCGDNDSQQIAMLTNPVGFNAAVSEIKEYRMVSAEVIEGSKKPIIPSSLMKKETHKDEFSNTFFESLRQFDKEFLNNFDLDTFLEREVHLLRVKATEVILGKTAVQCNNSLSFFSTRFIARQGETIPKLISVVKGTLYVKQQIYFSVELPNITKIKWNFGDNQEQEGKTFIKHTFRTEGYFKVKAAIFLFGRKFPIFSYKEVWIEKQKEPLKPISTVSEDLIRSRALKNIQASNNTLGHLSPACFIVAPSEKRSFYCCYRDKKDSNLKIIFFKGPKDIPTNPVFQEFGATPLDLQCYHNILFLLYRNEKDGLAVCTLTSQGEKINTAVLFENKGKKELYPTSQIQLKKMHSSELPVGTNAMYDPIQGKLKPYRDKILIQFTYSNYFGNKTGVEIEDVGETILLSTFDLEIFEEVRAWATSHCLNSGCTFSGDFFYSASLGDSLPSNINLFQASVEFSEDLIDFEYLFAKDKEEFIRSFKDGSLFVNNVKLEVAQKMLLPFNVPSNRQGMSSARFGGIIEVEGKVLVLYSIYDGVYRAEEEFDQSIKNEMGIYVFDSEFREITRKKIGEGKFVNSLKITRLGDKLLVLYSKAVDVLNGYLTDGQAIEDEFYMLLLDLELKFCSVPINLNVVKFNISDEVRCLSDGTAVWAYVDQYYNPFLHYIEPV